MKKLLLGTLATLCIALGLTIAKPIEANAASVEIETVYGYVPLHEDSYSDYLMWKQADGHYIVFYNGDITCSAITDTEATLVFPGTAVVYSYENNYKRTESTGISFPVAYKSLTYYSSTKAFTYTDDVNTINLSAKKYVTTKQAANATIKACAEINFPSAGCHYFTERRGDVINIIFYSTSYSVSYYLSSSKVGIHTTSGTGQTITPGVRKFVYNGDTLNDTGWDSTFAMSINEWKTWRNNNFLFSDNSFWVSGGPIPGVTDVQTRSIYGDARTAKFESYLGTSDVEIEVVPTIVNITLPLNVGLAINVNAEDAVVHGDIAVTNNSKAPVKVKLHAVSSADIPFTNLIKPTDLPAELNWDLLNLENSQKYFAFGVKPEEEGDTWKSITATDYVWAESGFTPTELGVIAGSTSGELSLDARFGRVQTTEHDFTFSATFVAELQ